MSDQPSKRTLSEISHLFLSSVREKAGNGGARPQRKPPTPRPQASIDLTPEEFAQVLSADQRDAVSAHARANITAVLASHLNNRQLERAREYARQLASEGQRIGMIVLDASEFRIICFDRDAHAATEPETCAEAHAFDPRRMSDALEELSYDIDRWLILLTSPRTPESRAVLRQIDHWALLCACDHDGVVSCYRTLKGLADLHRPRLSLALLDAHSAAEAGQVFSKLSGVCRQFLNWTLESEAAIRPVQASEHQVMCCRPTHNKAALGSAPQWQVVSAFIDTLHQRAGQPPQQTNSSAEPIAQEETSKMNIAGHASIVEPLHEEPQSADVFAETRSMPVLEKPVSRPTAVLADESYHAEAGEISEVIDLPQAHDTPAAVLDAVLTHEQGDLIQTPVRAPMCPDARLAVTRDRRLVLLAAASKGLSDLRSIGLAYRWLMENRALVSMALPQLRIDAHQLPRLRLMIDQADMSADVLQPMLHSGNVSVQTYRKLKWAGKTGLLLEAA